MRNTDQRVQAALLGAKKIKKQQTQRRLQALLGASSLCLVLMIAMVVPTLVEPFATTATTSGFTASIFANSQSLGYVMVGLVSFTLGVLFTILSVLVRKTHSEEDHHHDT